MDGKQSAIRLEGEHGQSFILPKKRVGSLDAFLLGPPADENKQVSAWILLQVGPFLRLPFKVRLGSFKFLVNGNI